MFLRAAAKVLAKISANPFFSGRRGRSAPGLETLAGDWVLQKMSILSAAATGLAELLSISFAGVLTSFAEGFSNSIIEYMAAGKPVVATDVGGAAEAIVEGETGYLVKSNDRMGWR